MTTTNPTSYTIPWNLVTRNLHGHELLRKKLLQKIQKLTRHLRRFPPGTVHLLVVLEKHPKKEEYTAGLTLRVPSNILRAEQSGGDVIQALDEAVKTLLRELESLKAELRRDMFWKRKARRAALRQMKAAGFAAEPQPEGEGPQNMGDVIRALLAEHYQRLLRFVRRQLWHDITAGELAPGAIDPRAVVDEVARRALREPGRKPARVSWVLWLFQLARQELQRRRKEVQRRQKEVVPIETETQVPEALLAEGYDPEQPLDIIERELEPPVATTADLVADPRAEPPDQWVARRELLGELRRLVSQWPRQEREAFELHFVEGFEPEEVAMILGLTAAQGRALIQQIQARLRNALLELAAV
jgi:ribosomal subunit interface protein